MLTAKKIIVSGKVQGVGFRPFIYRLAEEHQLTGWVRNCVGTVEILVQGEALHIGRFVEGISSDKPPLAEPKLQSEAEVKAETYKRFTILESEEGGEVRISVPNDLFLCDDCLSELKDPNDRRFGYPFINCTQCGPRYTLIKSLPYDRPNTTMVGFELCEFCRHEYENPADRRFHAEPIACPECGPSLSFRKGSVFKKNNLDAIEETVARLKAGEVVAVKGIGGYHLMCDAENTDAVRRLRENKPRPDKPLAVMFPSPVDKPLVVAEQSVELTEIDRACLLKSSRPIVLVKEKPGSQLSAQISPGLNEVGLMLPYSPLHHLLLDAFCGPLVATSANISGEPVLTDNDEVETRLAHVADSFLHHDRPIERPADDPVYRVIGSKARPIRTGRGSAPVELELPFELSKAVLAVGTQMKNVIALAWGNRVVISPHIGEMDSVRSLSVFENTIADLQALYDIEVEHIICDAHPGYSTSRWAGQQSLPVTEIFHHHAHASSAYYEAATSNPVIAFTWDGVGYGEDANAWGGETFFGRPGDWTRVARMHPFYLPGGDRAAREPWRCAAALCWELGIDHETSLDPDGMMKQAWQNRINTPQTTSVGRLFDAAAALTDVCQQASYEGQAAMLFEAMCAKTDNDHIELELNEVDGLYEVDWSRLVPMLMDGSISPANRSSCFHLSLAKNLLDQANLFREKHGIDSVCLSGGVFQNRVLSEAAISLLEDNGFKVCFPELIPVNDAGISFGQVIEYGYSLWGGTGNAEAAEARRR